MHDIERIRGRTCAAGLASLALKPATMEFLDRCVDNLIAERPTDPNYWATATARNWTALYQDAIRVFRGQETSTQVASYASVKPSGPVFLYPPWTLDAVRDSAYTRACHDKGIKPTEPDARSWLDTYVEALFKLHPENYRKADGSMNYYMGYRDALRRYKAHGKAYVETSLDFATSESELARRLRRQQKECTPDHSPVPAFVYRCRMSTGAVEYLDGWEVSRRLSAPALTIESIQAYSRVQ